MFHSLSFHIPSLFLLLAIAFATKLHAEPFSYAGKVVNEAGQALPWALIRVQGSDTLVQSNAAGLFSVSGNSTAPTRLDMRSHSTTFFPDPLSPSSRKYQISGRVAVPHQVAATLLWTRPSETRKESRLAGIPLAKSAYSINLTVQMAHYQTGNFLQLHGPATNLVLTLEKSQIDTATYAVEKKLCLDTINALRASVGAKAVLWSQSLEAFADQGVRYDSERNAPHAHFGAFSKMADPSDAENSIPGWSIKGTTVAQIVAKGAKMMWDEGPSGGHYENIKANHTEVGCGIFITADQKVWVTHNFK